MIFRRLPSHRACHLAGVLISTALVVTSPVAMSQSMSQLRSPLADRAGPRAHDADKDKNRRPAPNVAPGEAARRAAREYGGRVLNVVLEDGPGGPYYRVKLLDGGRVRVVHVEARN